MKKLLKAYLSRFLIKHVFNTISADQLLNVDDHVVTLRGIPLTREQTIELSKRAKGLLHDDLLMLLLDDWKYLGEQTVFQTSQSWDDVMYGKSMLYLHGVLLNKLKELASKS